MLQKGRVGSRRSATSVPFSSNSLSPYALASPMPAKASHRVSMTPARLRLATHPNATATAGKTMSRVNVKATWSCTALAE